MRSRISRALLLSTLAVPLSTGAAPAAAQWSTVHEQTYLPASHNWAFRQSYAFADLLFNAFDYGHAILYETLYTKPNADPSLLEQEIFGRLTRKILIQPPRVPLEEAAIMVQYAKLVPEAKLMFEWAHMLHRQAYDVWADESISLQEKDAHMAEILAYYQSRPDIAFSSLPKSMELMDGQYYSLAFRERYPRFNGLIWAYHWLQVGLYEPLMVGRDADERQALAQATAARFWQMLERPPESMPYLMPMTAAIAPTFSARYPEMAVIFDNLHMMHDVVSDILASEEVPKHRKRAEIMRAIELFTDDTSYIISQDEWREMAMGMGLHNQGGAAVGILPDPPQPTVPRGMSMAPGEGGAEHQHGAPAGAGDELRDGPAVPNADAPPSDQHDAHNTQAAPQPGGDRPRTAPRAPEPEPEPAGSHGGHGAHDAGH